MKEVVVGIIGAGRAAELHLEALKYVGTVNVRVKKIGARRKAQLLEKVNRYEIEEWTISYNDLLNDPEIDVIDICTPPYVHIEMIEQAIEAGKHVICEKPLGGYFGEIGEENIGDTVKKSKMFEKLNTSLDALGHLLLQTDRKFMYAENFVYAPAIQRVYEFIEKRRSKVLFIKGEESLKGSSSSVAGEWGKTGGGSLIRTGIHPLTAALAIKSRQAKTENRKITVRSVICDTDRITTHLSENEHRHIAAHPLDVEDFSSMIITFSDRSKCLITATDTLLGGSKNIVEIYCNDAAFVCNLTMNNVMKTFFPDEIGLENVNISEMLPIKTGWNYAFVADEILRGYISEMRDFMESIAYDRTPISDFSLASETMRVIYAGYLSSERREEVVFN